MEQVLERQPLETLTNVIEKHEAERARVYPLEHADVEILLQKQPLAPQELPKESKTQKAWPAHIESPIEVKEAKPPASKMDKLVVETRQAEEPHILDERERTINGRSFKFEVPESSESGDSRFVDTAQVKPEAGPELKPLIYDETEKVKELPEEEIFLDYIWQRAEGKYTDVSETAGQERIEPEPLDFLPLLEQEPWFDNLNQPFQLYDEEFEATELLVNAETEQEVDPWPELQAQLVEFIDVLVPEQAEEARDIVAEISEITGEIELLLTAEPELEPELKQEFEQQLEAKFAQLFECLRIEADEAMVKRLVEAIINPEETVSPEEPEQLTLEELNFRGTREYKSNKEPSSIRQLIKALKQKLTLHIHLGRYALREPAAL